jgi:hypothetical protein
MHRAPRTCHPMGLARQVRLGVPASSGVPAPPVRSAAGLTLRARPLTPAPARGSMANPAPGAGGKTLELA